MKQVSRLDFFCGVLLVCTSIYLSNGDYLAAFPTGIIAVIFALVPGNS